MDLSSLRGVSDEETVNETLHSGYMSLLGGVAWTVLTRAEAAIYVQALQRRAHAPRATDCRRLNVVVRYLQRHKHSLTYEKLSGDLKLGGLSDAAFRSSGRRAIGVSTPGADCSPD